MRIKTIPFILVILFLAIISTGCGSQTEIQGVSSGNRRPDFGQPDRPADIIGLVKSITGNEATVIKIDRSERAKREASESEGDGNSPEGGEERGGFNLKMVSGGGGGKMMGAGGPGQGTDEDSRAAMIERVKEMSSGEEKVIIPIGIRMLKPDLSSAAKGQPEILEAVLTDITADKMINIWLDESATDKKVAEFVMITR